MYCSFLVEIVFVGAIRSFLNKDDNFEKESRLTCVVRIGRP